MSKKQFSEKDLQRLLREMPLIEDQRSKDEVFHMVKKRLQEEMESPRQRRRPILWPVIASIAAMFLIFVLSTSLLFRNDDLAGSNQAELDREQFTMEDELPGIVLEENQSTTQDQLFTNEIKIADAALRTAIYEEDLAGNEFTLTLNVPDEMFQNAIPVSVIVQDIEGRTWLDQYIDVMNGINEEELGLAEYYPLNGTFTLTDAGSVSLNLNSNHTYTMGTAGETMFFKSLDALKYQGIAEVHLFENFEPGIQLHHEDEKLTVYSIRPTQNTGYLLYETDRQVFLTPSPNSYETIGESFQEMKTGIEKNELAPSIPDFVDFKIIHENPDTLSLSFSPTTEFPDDRSFVYMIEAILLTAKEFGFQYVHFNNIGMDHFQDFDFTKPVHVPVAPNRIQLTLQ